MTNEILNSATKIVLLLLVVALIVFIFTGKIDQDIFKTVMISVISFYFGQKTNVPVMIESTPINREVIDEVSSIDGFKK